MSSFHTLGILEPLASRMYDSIAYRRNWMFVAGKKVESCVNVMVDNLYHAVFCLTFLCVRLGISTYVDVEAIY